MWSVALGKGIREPVYPYRQFVIFGSPLNPTPPPPYNRLPLIVDELAVFDVSSLDWYQEVLLCLVTGAFEPAGHYVLRYRWYNAMRNVMIYDATAQFDLGAQGEFYNFSYIGLVPWEISENGKYRVDVLVEGPDRLERTLYFDVTGVPPPPPQPAPSGENVFDSVRNGFISLTQVLVDAAIQIKDNVLLKPLLWLLNGMSTYTSQIAGWFYDASRWYNEVTAAVNRALSWDGIRDAILEWLPWLPAATDWFEDAAARISAAIASWWEGAQGDVKGWLAAARDEVLEWLESFVNFEALGTWWEERTADVKGWIQAARDALLEAADAMIAPVRDQVNKHSATLQLLTDPSDAALRWLQERIELMIARLW